MEEHETYKPWYKYPMLWLVIGIPMLSVFGGVCFIYLANHFPNDVVKDNYYKDGLAINQQFAQDERAKALGLTATVSIDNSSAIMQVTLSTTDQPYIRFSMFHSTDRDQDVLGAMAKSPTLSNTYVFAFEQLPKGRWFIEIKGDNGQATDNWRLRGRLMLPLAGNVSLSPMQQ